MPYKIYVYIVYIYIYIYIHIYIYINFFSLNKNTSLIHIKSDPITKALISV